MAKKHEKKQGQRKAYVAPVIRSSDAFERLALACSGNAQLIEKSGFPRCDTVGAS